MIIIIIFILLTLHPVFSLEGSEWGCVFPILFLAPNHAVCSIIKHGLDSKYPLLPKHRFEYYFSVYFFFYCLKLSEETGFLEYNFKMSGFSGRGGWNPLILLEPVTEQLIMRKTKLIKVGRLFLSMNVNGNVMGRVLKVVGEYLTLIQKHFF